MRGQLNFQEIVKAAKEVFSKKEEIIVAYIYGSFLKSNHFQDVDIGILVKDDCDIGPLYEAKIAGEFERRLKLKFDVRILNGRPVKFLFSVLKNSKLIYSKDEHKRIEFESKIMKESLDIKPYHEMYEKMRRNRYERGVRWKN